MGLGVLLPHSANEVRAALDWVSTKAETSTCLCPGSQ